jgi:hypothetical protein
VNLKTDVRETVTGANPSPSATQSELLAKPAVRFVKIPENPDISRPRPFVRAPTLTSGRIRCDNLQSFYKSLTLGDEDERNL